MQVAAEVWADICSGAAESEPWRLTRFLVLMHGDLKHYKFNYWWGAGLGGSGRGRGRGQGPGGCRRCSESGKVLILGAEDVGPGRRCRFAFPALKPPAPFTSPELPPTRLADALPPAAVEAVSGAAGMGQRRTLGVRGMSRAGRTGRAACGNGPRPPNTPHPNTPLAPPPLSKLGPRSPPCSIALGSVYFELVFKIPPGCCKSAQGL